MPRAAGTGKGRSQPITVMLPPEEFAWYKTQANMHGVPMNAHLTKLLVEGAVAGKVQEFEERMQRLIAQIPESVTKGAATIPEPFLLSLLTCEAILSEIAGSQDKQVLYRAQDAAKQRLAKLKGG